MSALADPLDVAPFDHGAFLYADDDEYLGGTVPFIEAGLEAGEPILVAVPSPRLDLLRPYFRGRGQDQLRFAPMEQMGRNPAWIIPAWAEFVEPFADCAARGIGEPIWHGRSPAELVECGRHEALLNVAFAHADNFQLLCPYNTELLDEAVLDEAHRNHPSIHQEGERAQSDEYAVEFPAWLEDPLPPRSHAAEVIPFGAGPLGPLRHRVEQVATAAGLSPARIADLMVAVGEAASNSIRHAGGAGELAVWVEGPSIVCEVSDRGRITDPLAGRLRPEAQQHGGRGLWLMNQMCDLVQIRVRAEGQIVRLHIAV